MKLTDIKISINPLIPDNWIGFDTKAHFYLFTQGLEVTLDKNKVDINNYLEELFK